MFLLFLSNDVSFVFIPLIVCELPWSKRWPAKSKQQPKHFGPKCMYVLLLLKLCSMYKCMWHILFIQQIFHIHRNRESARPIMGSNTNSSYCTQMVRNTFYMHTYLQIRFPHMYICSFVCLTRLIIPKAFF